MMRAAVCLVCACLVAGALVGVASAASATITTGTYSIPAVGGTVEVPIVLGAATGGLSGYLINVALSNPSVGEITAVSFPGWAVVNNQSSLTLPASSVDIAGVDIMQQVPPAGSTSLVLATLTIRGTAVGSSAIVITPDPVLGVEDELGDLYSITATDGTVTVVPPTPAILSVTDFSPEIVYRGSTVTATITGTGFKPGAQVKLQAVSSTGTPMGIPVYPTDETVVDGETIRCTVKMSASAWTGRWSAAVANPSAPSTWVSLANAFTVLSAGATTPTTVATTPTTVATTPTTVATTPTTVATTPTVAPTLSVTGFSPEIVYRGSTVTATITGTGFAPGAQVKLQAVSSTGTPMGIPVYPTDETVVDGETIRCTVKMSASAWTGRWSAAVANPSAPSTWVSLANAFTVLPAGATTPTTVATTPTTVATTPTTVATTPTTVATTPTVAPVLSVTDFSPEIVYRGTTVTATITGTGFASGAQVKLQAVSSTGTPMGIPVYPTDETVVDGETIRCTVRMLSSAWTGRWSAAVANPSAPSTWVGLANAFTVMAPASATASLSATEGDETAMLDLSTYDARGYYNVLVRHPGQTLAWLVVVRYI